MRQVNHIRQPAKKTSFFGRCGLWIGLCLVLAVFAAYWQVTGHSFISYDDNLYVTGNAYVQKGLSPGSIKWAFSLNDVSYWQPLAWLYHMLDVELYGLNAGMHHFTSLAIHVLSSLLLLIVFNRMTGKLWRSAFVAACFALHPLNVESIAWIAERKNVISTFFWILTVLSYTLYVERPGHLRYLSVVLCFILGLMAKPMLATLPFVLLLLDIWPLNRWWPGSNDFKPSALWQLLIEKIPLFVIAYLSTVVSWLSFDRFGAMTSIHLKALNLRIANALISYVAYLGKILWPHKMAFLYPYPLTVSLWQSIGSGCLLLSFSVAFFTNLRRAPYLGVGWLWFLGTLVPVIGLVQAGFWPAMADRYTYVPAIGIFLIIAWGLPDLVAGSRHKKIILLSASAVVLLFFSTVTFVQVQYWRDSKTLYEHTLEVTTDNFLVHNNLGNVYFRNHKLPEAVYHFSEALRINPRYATAHNNLGATLTLMGEVDRAMFHLKEAIKINPDFALAQKNLKKIRYAETGKSLKGKE
jgi:tetratricopeptide (TPR) repeat protein